MVDLFKTACEMMRRFFSKIYHGLLRTEVYGKGNKIEIASKREHDFKIVVRGNHNEIKIGKNCLLSNTVITVQGDNNHIVIEDNARFIGPCRVVMAGGSTLHIGNNAGIRGVEFNLDGGASINVGALCMFSNGIVVRNHDSHKVIDRATGVVTNVACDITLGEHVWVCQNSTVLKGVTVGDHAVVAYGAVVVKDCPAHAVVAGNPAKVVKNNIDWDY